MDDVGSSSSSPGHAVYVASRPRSHLLKLLQHQSWDVVVVNPRGDVWKVQPRDTNQGYASRTSSQYAANAMCERIRKALEREAVPVVDKRMALRRKNRDRITAFFETCL